LHFLQTDLDPKFNSLHAEQSQSPCFLFMLDLFNSDTVN